MPKSVFILGGARTPMTQYVGALKDVSAIDLGLILQTFDNIFSKASFVVEFMALFTVVTGVIVLAGAVLIGRHQRIRESVLLRSLGSGIDRRAYFLSKTGRRLTARSIQRLVGKQLDLVDEATIVPGGGRL